jgi:hypothetical protein
MRKPTMKTLGTAVALAAGIALGAGGATAQDKSATDKAWDTTALKQMTVETDSMSVMLGKTAPSRESIFELAELYRTNALDPASLRGLMARSLHTYLVQKNAPRGGAGAALQAAGEAQLQLAAIQVYQNERMIMLLEELKKRSP